MSDAAESFLYIWYDTKNKKYYLGKHKGTPDDSYTHSSTIMESFSKDNIPSYMRRRILAYGTDEEMCLLEHECLKNRKEKKWDRYYNQSLGSPWLDQSGENNPMYGKTMSEEKKEYRRQWMKNHWATKRKGWKLSEEAKFHLSKVLKSKYDSGELIPPMLGKTLSEETKQKIAEKATGRTHSEETKKAMSKSRKGKGNANYKHGLAKDKDHARKLRRERMKDPVKREAYNKYMREYNAKKKAERLASGATLPI